MKVCSRCGNEGKFKKRKIKGKEYEHGVCTKCQLVSECSRIRARRKGIGPECMLGRFRILLPRLKYHSRSQGYKEPNITPEQMMRIWQSQEGFCIACGEKLNLLGFNSSCFDHDHESGKPRGFIHDRCNRAEGIISKMSHEGAENYLSWIKTILARRAEMTRVAPGTSASHAG